MTHQSRSYASPARRAKTRSLRRLVSRLTAYAIIGLMLFYILFPLYWMLLSSFRSPNTIFIVNYWPTNLTPINYRTISLWPEFSQAVKNSVLVAAAVVILTLALGSAAAYVLARLKFRGQRSVRHAVLFMAAFPQIAIVGGLYTIIVNPCIIVGRECRQLSPYNSVLSLIFSYLILTLPLTIWFLAIYFKNLPQELEDAAYVDGASPWQAYRYVVLPMAAPALVTTGLLAFIIAWNEFMFALTFTIDQRSRTAPVMIANMGGWGSLTDLAAAVVVMVPVVLLAVLLRRQLTAGLTGFVSLRSMSQVWLDQQRNRLGLGGWRLDIPTQLLLGMLAILGLSFGYMALKALTFPYPLDYGEGPLLNQTALLARFENIYRPHIDQPPFTVANYPPLFMLLQVPFYWLFGPALWYGRLISILAALIAAVGVGLILQRLTGDRLAAVLAGLTLLAIPYVSGWSVLNRIDALALGLSMLGLWLMVRAGQERQGWSLLVGALLLTAAVYTRQSYGLAAPLAALVWLLSERQWRPAVLLVLLVGGLGLALFALLNLLTGGGFYFNVVTANVNAFDLDRLERFLEELWVFMPYLVVGTGLFVVTGVWFRAPAWWLVAPYSLGAALSALTVGKVGSNINYFLELAVAMSLAAGALIAWQRSRSWLRQGIILLLTFQLYLLLPGMPQLLWLEWRFGQPGQMARLTEIVHQSGGPVLADDAMAIIPLDNRPLYIQPFEVTQLARAGLWNQTPFLEAVARHEFATIVMLRVSTPDGMLQEINWSPQMLAAINRYYYVAEILGEVTFVYRPRSSSAVLAID